MTRKEKDIAYKDEIVTKYAQKRGIFKKHASKDIEILLETLEELMVEHDAVMLKNFGSYNVRKRKSTKADKPETINVVFKAGAKLKKRLVEAKLTKP